MHKRKPFKPGKGYKRRHLKKILQQPHLYGLLDRLRPVEETDTTDREA